MQLSGWSLIDGKAKAYTLPDLTIAPNGYAVLPYSETHLTLTNTGGTLTLRDPSGGSQSTVDYDGNGVEGQSFSRTSAGTFVWVDVPTSGGENRFPAPTLPAAATVPDATATTPTVTIPSTDTAPATDAAPVTAVPSDAASPCPCATTATSDATPTTINELGALADGTAISVRGIVSLAPGRVGKTIFAMQEPDGHAGVYVRIYGIDQPVLAVGDEIDVTGKIAHANGEVRITTTKAGIVPTGNTTTVAPNEIGSNEQQSKPSRTKTSIWQLFI